LLGILILADLFAITYHRRNARWGHVLRLLPAAFAGIVAGYFGLKFVNDQQLKPIIGGIVLVMLGVNYWRTRAKGEDAPVPTQWWFAVGLGFMAGVTTMMANAAGPIMIIYGYAAAQGRICGNRSVVLFCCQLAQSAVQRQSRVDDGRIRETQLNDAAVHCDRGGCGNIPAKTHPAKGI